jgi:hypothetical protein
MLKRENSETSSPGLMQNPYDPQEDDLSDGEVYITAGIQLAAVAQTRAGAASEIFYIKVEGEGDYTSSSSE